MDIPAEMSLSTISCFKFAITKRTSAAQSSPPTHRVVLLKEVSGMGQPHVCRCCYGFAWSGYDLVQSASNEIKE